MSLVFVAIFLFVMVPQLPLVDSDDDGITDLSAIVIGASPIAHSSSSTGKDERRRNSLIAVAPASNAIQHRPFTTDRADPIFHDCHSVLASLCLLRC